MQIILLKTFIVMNTKNNKDNKGILALKQQ